MKTFLGMALACAALSACAQDHETNLRPVYPTNSLTLTNRGAIIITNSTPRTNGPAGRPSPGTIYQIGEEQGKRSLGDAPPLPSAPGPGTAPPVAPAPSPGTAPGVGQAPPLGTPPPIRQAQ